MEKKPAFWPFPVAVRWKYLRLLSEEYGSDALRNTLAVLIPGIAIYSTGRLEMAIAVGVGALLVTLTDLPGNRRDKWLSAGVTVFLWFVTSLVVSFSLPYPWLLIPLLAVMAFIYAMLAALGPRFAVMGTMALILAAFVIGLRPENSWGMSVQVSMGAAWYYALSLVQIHLWPFRSLGQALSDGFRSTAVLLREKAACYDPQVPLAESYRRISRLHVRVSEQQELVRRLLLRERKMVRAAGESARYWLGKAYGLIDLYELVTAIDHDYESIRKALGPTGALPVVRHLIDLLAAEVEALTKGGTNKSSRGFPQERRQAMEAALKRLRMIAASHGGAPGNMLQDSLRNMEQILSLAVRISGSPEALVPLQAAKARVDYRPFLSLPREGWRGLRSQFAFGSSVFSFALRLAVLFGLGGLLGLMLPRGDYGYWILLTVVIVARPEFAATQQRNLERISGTFAGVLLGTGLLFVISNPVVLLVLAAVFLFGFFAFFRLHYTISVLCLTPAVIVGLELYQGNIADILGSRLAFTLLGCLLAWGGWYLFPVRQSRGLKALTTGVREKNKAYYQAVLQHRREKGGDFELRLARKEAHAALAAFSAALEQLRKEPGGRRRDWGRIESFHMLAYRVNALITGLALSARGEEQELFSAGPAGHPRIVRLSDMLEELDALEPA